MFRKGTIKLPPSLYARADAHARAAGYACAEDYVAHLVETDLARQAKEQTRQDLTARMKGLGYIE